MARENNDDAKCKKTRNDVKPLIMDTKTLHNMQVIMQKCSKDSTETSFLPQNVENLLFNKQKNGIEKVDICCCAKLSRCNSFLLHELPIPSFVKNIIVNETNYQHGFISSKKHVKI